MALKSTSPRMCPVTKTPSIPIGFRPCLILELSLRRSFGRYFTSRKRVRDEEGKWQPTVDTLRNFLLTLLAEMFYFFQQLRPAIDETELITRCQADREPHPSGFVERL